MNYPKVADPQYEIRISPPSLKAFTEAMAGIVNKYGNPDHIRPKIDLGQPPFVSVSFDGESLGFTLVPRVKFVKGHWRPLSHTTFCRKLRRKLRAARR